MNANWLKENIRSVISVILVIHYCWVIGYAINHRMENNPVIMGVINVLMFLLGYYFAASKDKLPPNENK